MQLDPNARIPALALLWTLTAGAAGAQTGDSGGARPGREPAHLL